MPPTKAIVYTRAGCHLCEVAEEVLTRHGLQCELIDVDSDPELQAKYDQCVPVVLINDQVRFRGRVNEMLLKRLLSASN